MRLGQVAMTSRFVLDILTDCACVIWVKLTSHPRFKARHLNEKADVVEKEYNDHHWEELLGKGRNLKRSALDSNNLLMAKHFAKRDLREDSDERVHHILRRSYSDLSLLWWKAHPPG